RLGISSAFMNVTPVRLPPGRAKLSTNPSATGSPPVKMIGIVEVAFFAASAKGETGCHDYVDLAGDEISGQCGQPIIASLRPAVFDCHVLAFDVAGFAPSPVEPSHKPCKRAGRSGAEDADYRQRLLLGAEGTRR